MLNEFAKAFILILLAEMGDKTQIIAMTFATKYLIKDVVLGVVLGVLANHGMAIISGGYISKSVPLSTIQAIAGIMFIFFGFTSLKEEELDEFENNKSVSPVVTVALAFFIGELGDKTQLTALTLAIESNYPLLILVGTTSAMVATSLIGIYVGSKIGDKVPELQVKVVSSLVFVLLGTLKFFKSVDNIELIKNNTVSLVIVIVAIEILLIFRLGRRRVKIENLSAMEQAAYDIHKQTTILKKTIDAICLGENKCGKCSGKKCLIGYVKFQLADARKNSEYYDNHYVKLDCLLRKSYDKKKVLEALVMILLDNEKYGWPIDKNFIINKIRYSMEYILVMQTLGIVTDLSIYIDQMKIIDKNVGESLEKKIVETRLDYQFPHLT